MANKEIPECDQWELSGACRICRRKDYCSKECTAHRSKRERFFLVGMLAQLISATHLSDAVDLVREKDDTKDDK